MSQSVVCIVPDINKAEAIVYTLKNTGFSTNNISILMPDTDGLHDAGHEKHSKAPEGTATGAGAGAIIGGALALLAGTGSLAIPGIGPLLAAGPIMAALSGVAVGGTIGGITGGLIGLGIPEYEAKIYEGKLQQGDILISAHAADGKEAQQAESIFKAGGAIDIHRVSEEKTQPFKKAG